MPDSPSSFSDLEPVKEETVTVAACNIGRAIGPLTWFPFGTHCRKMTGRDIYERENRQMDHMHFRVRQ